MGRALARVLVAVGATGALLGCGGPPGPVPAGTGAASTAASPASVSPLGTRPASLPVAGIDPCRLLTPAQAGGLGVTVVGGPDATRCQWSNHAGRPDLRYRVELFPGQGAEYALRSVDPHQVVTVAGFPAVQTSAGGEDPAIHCLLFVDAAAGQSVSVLFANLGGDYPGMSHEVACGLARAAAAEVVGTLRTVPR